MQFYRSCLEGSEATRAKSAGIAVCAFSAIVLFAPIAAQGADLGTLNEAVPAASDQAEVSRIDRAFAALHRWNVVIGAAALVQPEYEGSDKFDVVPFPLVSASYGDWLYLDAEGITADVYKNYGFTVGVRGSYDLGRKEDDSDYLRGLGNIDAGGVLGGVVSYETGPFKLYAEVGKIIGGSDGLTGTVGASATQQYKSFIFSADASATFADDNYMEAYFGVNASQSARSGLARYDAQAGLKRVDLKASVTYVFNEHWSVTGTAGTGLLMGDAKDSPVVKEKVQPFGMLGMAYSF